MIARSLACLALACTLTGCASSPWKANFEGEPGIAPLAPIPDDVVVVRPAPYERVEAALRAFEEAWAESDTYWEDWPESKKREHTDRLIEALQLPAGTDQWTLLGHTRFTSVNDIDPEGADLRGLAADVGADHAIWSSLYLGKTQRVVDRPVHYPSWHYSHTGHGHGGYGIGSHTVWVRDTIEADETLWMAFFLRQR